MAAGKQAQRLPEEVRERLAAVYAHQDTLRRRVAAAAAAGGKVDRWPAWLTEVWVAELEREVQEESVGR